MYTVRFLRNYQVIGDDPDHSINRETSEALYSINGGVTDPNLLLGLQAVEATESTVSLYLIGYSGFQCASEVVQVWMDGCVLSHGLCNNTQTVTVSDSTDATLPYTCVVSLSLVSDSTLSPTAVLSIILPPSAHMMALRQRFIQGQSTSPSGLWFSIGAVDWFTTMTHPSAPLPNATTYDDSVGGGNLALAENVLARRIECEWSFGLVAWSYQANDDTNPDFQTVWYSTVNDDTDGIFPLASVSSYPSSQAEPILIELRLTAASTFTLQVTEKLIQPTAYFTILLGLIAILPPRLLLH